MPDAPVGRHPAIASGGTPRVLREIHAPGRGLVIWHRRVAGDVAGAMEELARQASLNAGLTVDRRHIAPALASVLPGGETAALRFLRSDIRMLVRRFAALSRSDRVEMRLETIGHDACRKFHYDQVPWRLIVTYAGPPTQWVPAEQAARALAEQQAYDGEILSFPRFAICLFKGARSAAHAVLHRSPPIAGTGTRRLVLCLNAPSAISPPEWLPPTETDS